mmetsp:Transcript_14383/g.43751  ORF Transcript_14383/g.43751 Transcript_14383/m.43751 type:complete len:230 (-) Transcript_14383:934-1623(-)
MAPPPPLRRRGRRREHAGRVLLAGTMCLAGRRAVRALAEAAWSVEQTTSLLRYQRRSAQGDRGARQPWAPVLLREAGWLPLLAHPAPGWERPERARPRARAPLVLWALRKPRLPQAKVRRRRLSPCLREPGLAPCCLRGSSQHSSPEELRPRPWSPLKRGHAQQHPRAQTAGARPGLQALRRPLPHSQTHRRPGAQAPAACAGPQRSPPGCCRSPTCWSETAPTGASRH